ncbi:hypothetical protein [Rhodoluna limnophila]|jgi:hypothetical protein|uniref:hypothetical protein n=1 Tax=Rhodoluna limnophila TaxID=232537 RepID=UPI0011071C42|nr:hypothetical protein [Rhodoluna limnophila]
MVQPSSVKRWAALLLVATLVGFAPVFHVLCIAPMSDAHGSSMSHTMADGTTFTAPSIDRMDESHSVELATQAASSAEIVTSAQKVFLGDSKGQGGNLITIGPLIAYLLLGILLLVMRRRLITVARQARQIIRPPAFALRVPASVNLVALGISRT